MVGSVAILVGLVAMYVGKVESLSVKTSKKKEKKADNDQEEKK